MVKNLPANAGYMKDADLIPGGKIPWIRKWQPTPVFLPGKFHGWRSLVAYSPWNHKESDMTEQFHLMLFIKQTDSILLLAQIYSF